MTNQFASTLGVDIFTESSSRQHDLGTCIDISYGSNRDKRARLVYIKADVALSKNLVYELPQIGGTDAFVVDTSLNKTNAATIADAQNEVFPVCVPAIDITSGSYGWAFIKGHVPILSAGAFSLGDSVSISATAGKVDDADTDYQLHLTRAISAATGADEVIDIYSPIELLVKRNAA